MRKEELKLKKDGFNMSCNIYKARSHYKGIMALGRCFPSTPAQAKYFISNGICLDVLNGDDVEMVETMLNKHGFLGNYVLTKSKKFARLQNNSDLHKALKLEFNI